MAFSGESKFDN